MGGEIGLLQEGDTIEINIPEGTVNAKVSPEEFEARRKTYTMKECPIKEGWLARYTRLVASASEGAVLK